MRKKMSRDRTMPPTSRGMAGKCSRRRAFWRRLSLVPAIGGHPTGPDQAGMILAPRGAAAFASVVQVLALRRRQARSVEAAVGPRPAQPLADPAVPDGLEPGAGRTGRAFLQNIPGGIGEPVDLGALPLEADPHLAGIRVQNLAFELGRRRGRGELAALDDRVTWRSRQEHPRGLVAPRRSGAQLGDEEPAERGERDEDHGRVEEALEQLHGAPGYDRLILSPQQRLSVARGEPPAIGFATQGTGLAQPTTGVSPRAT